MMRMFIPFLRIEDDKAASPAECIKYTISAFRKGVVYIVYAYTVFHYLPSQSACLLGVVPFPLPVHVSTCIKSIRPRPTQILFTLSATIHQAHRQSIRSPPSNDTKANAFYSNRILLTTKQRKTAMSFSSNAFCPIYINENGCLSLYILRN